MRSGLCIESLGAVSPELVRRYLLSQDWSLARELPRAELWACQLPVGRIEVLLPKDQRLVDYAVELLHLFDTVALAEDRSPSDVLRDVTTTQMDIPSIRLFPEGVPSGTVPLHEGTRAFSSLRDLMVSAVYRAHTSMDGQPARPVEPGRKPNEVYEFLSRVRLGLTRPGSYVLTAEIPLTSAVPEQLRLDSHGRAGGLPLPRRVCLALYDGVAAANQAAKQAVDTGDREVFEQHTRKGLTANICESLAALSSDGRLPFQLQIAWANNLPTDRGTAPLRFDEPLIVALQEGAEFLRQRFGRPGVKLVGTIAKMVRTPTRGPGTILILASPDDDPGRMMRVYLDLEASDYQQASQAHGAGHQIQVQGDLTREGNRWYLRGATNFETSQVEGPD